MLSKVRVTAGACRNEVRKESNILNVYLTPLAGEGKVNKIFWVAENLKSRL